MENITWNGYICFGLRNIMHLKQASDSPRLPFFNLCSTFLSKRIYRRRYRDFFGTLDNGARLR